MGGYYCLNVTCFLIYNGQNNPPTAKIQNSPIIKQSDKSFRRQRDSIQPLVECYPVCLGWQKLSEPRFSMVKFRFCHVKILGNPSGLPAFLPYATKNSLFENSMTLNRWNFEQILVRKMKQGWRLAKMTSLKMPKLRCLRRVRVILFRLQQRKDSQNTAIF